MYICEGHTLSSQLTLVYKKQDSRLLLIYVCMYRWYTSVSSLDSSLLSCFLHIIYKIFIHIIYNTEDRTYDKLAISRHLREGLHVDI
jgi:hypothetical protein